MNYCLCLDLRCRRSARACAKRSATQSPSLGGHPRHGARRPMEVAVVLLVVALVVVVVVEVLEVVVVVAPGEVGELLRGAVSPSELRGLAVWPLLIHIGTVYYVSIDICIYIYIYIYTYRERDI